MLSAFENNTLPHKDILLYLSKPSLQTEIIKVNQIQSSEKTMFTLPLCNIKECYTEEVTTPSHTGFNTCILFFFKKPQNNIPRI